MKVEITKRIKLELKLSENSSGVITAPTPNIKNIFKTHEPTKLPTAKSVSFFITAIIEVIISGIAVLQCWLHNLQQNLHHILIRLLLL